MTTTDQDREDFEAWTNAQCSDETRDVWMPRRGTSYAHPITRGSWEAWQAALAHERARAASAPQAEPMAWVNESHRDQIIARSGSVYWHAPMMCGKKFEGSFPVYLAASAPPVLEDGRCEDCPPSGYPTDRTRCTPCDRRSHAARQAPDDGTCVRCGAAPRNTSGLCATCVDEDAVRVGEVEDDASQALWRKALDQERVTALTPVASHEPASVSNNADCVSPVGDNAAPFVEHPFAERMGESIAGMVIEWVDNAEQCDWRVSLAEVIARRVSRLLAETDAPPPEPAKAEVVAWQHRYRDRDGTIWSEWHDGRYVSYAMDVDQLVVEERPLYATPPTAPAAARSAAEEVQHECVCGHRWKAPIHPFQNCPACNPGEEA